MSRTYKMPKFKRGRLTNEIIDERIKFLDPNMERLSDYSRKGEMLWGCKLCGNRWIKNYNELTHMKNFCLVCAGQKLSNGIIDERLKPKGITRKSEFTTVNDRMDLVCDVCNYEWSPFCLSLFRINPISCPECAGNSPWTKETINEYLLEAGSNIILIGDYTNIEARTLWKCTRESCGYEWETSFATTKRSAACPLHTISRIETIVMKFLLDNHINFVYNQMFDDCRNSLTNTKFKFDFAIYDSEGNIILIIELDGPQHHELTKSHWIKIHSLAEMEESLKYVQFKDRQKNQYCDLHYPHLLLRIPFWKFSEAIDIIKARLSSLI